MASLKQQIFKRIDTLKRFGQSKKAAKKEQKLIDEILKEKTNSVRANGIYSKSTCTTYKKWSLTFASWERKKHPEKEFKILNNIPLQHIGEWLQESIDNAESGYTTRLKASSLAKIFGCHNYDFGVKLPSKKNDRNLIKRSRNDVKYDKHFSEKNNKDIVSFCKACGLRRAELSQLQPEQIKFNKQGKLIIDLDSKREYKLTTKGARGRIIEVIKSDYDYNIVLKAKELSEKMGQKTVFQKIHHALDVHSLRAVFAKRKYQEVISELKEKAEEIRLDYICRDGSGRRFNKHALSIVSKNLGHNRLDVVVKNYFYDEE